MFRRWLLRPMLCEVVHEFHNLHRKVDSFMSKISEFADAVNAKYTALTTSLDGIVADIQALDAKITELQNSQGALTPEDQALLDQIQASSSALADRAAAVDAEHPAPEPPPTT